MKNLFIFLFTGFAILAINACKIQQKNDDKIIVSDRVSDSDKNTSIILEKGKSFNHPTYVIWIEDKCGNFLKTIFITKAYASGVYNKKMIGDTLWVNEKGESTQPAALPYWNHRSGLNSVPNQNKPYTDAYSGATPKADFEFNTGILNDVKHYRILLEVNQPWDWNNYWTNNKYPDNFAYKHSAQPSMVYMAEVDEDTKEFYLNPIGHGDPTGNSGKLFTNLNTMTTAKDIFKNIILKNN